MAKQGIANFLPKAFLRRSSLWVHFKKILKVCRLHGPVYDGAWMFELVATK